MIYYLDSFGALTHRGEDDPTPIPTDWKQISAEEAEDMEFMHAVMGGGTLVQTKGPILFLRELKKLLGGVVGMNNFTVSYPIFMAAFDAKHWNDVRDLIIDATTTGKITAQQFADIKAAANKYQLPISW